MSLSLTKMAVLTGYANTISLKEFAKNRLFLVTPAGMISGIPVFDEENSNPNIAVAQTVNSSALKAVSKAASAEEESPQTGESCEFILLKDARLETTSPVVNFPVLTVFCALISPMANTSRFCRPCTANTRAAISLGSPVILIFIFFTSLEM